MKKLLSAVLAILMIMSAATFTGSVFAAADTYTPDDGKPVVYVASSGADEKTTFSDLNAAIIAVDKKGGGYVVLNENFTKSTAGFTEHTNMVIIRGKEVSAGSEKIKLELFNMNNLGGPLTFENIHLHWYNNISAGDSQDYALNANSFDASTPASKYKVVMGKQGVENDVETSHYKDNPVSGHKEIIGIRSGDVTINSGDFYVGAGKFGNSPTYDNFTVTLNGGKLTGISVPNGTAAQLASMKTTINGNLTLNFNGGTTSFTGFTGQSKAIVSGNVVFNVKDTIFTGASLGFDNTTGGITVNGMKTMDFSKCSETAPSFEVAAWDIVYPKEKKIEGTATLDSTSFESGVTYVGADASAKLIINGDITLTDATAFKDITIENGEGGRIIANGKKLTIAETVDTAVGADGKFIDIVTGSVNGSAVVASVVIMNGTYNSIVNNGAPDSKCIFGNDVVTVVNDYKMNALAIGGETENLSDSSMEVTVSDFTDGIQVGKYAPTESENWVEYVLGRDVDSDILTSIKVQYYLNVEEDDGNDAVGTKPYVVINDTEIDAKQALAAGWNILNFDISGNDEFDVFTFYPYGDAEAVQEHNKMYVSDITISLIEDTGKVEYSDPELMAGNGDFVPKLDDFVMDFQALVNPINRTPTGLHVDDAPFTNGMAAMVTPVAGAAESVMLQYKLTDANGGNVSLGADFIPYVRVEFYLNVKDDESFEGVYPKLQIPGHAPFVAEKSLVNGWNVATFNISDAESTFPGFFFYPYGDATALNKWNKMYIASVTFSQTENKKAPIYAVPDIDKETGDVKAYIFNPEEELENIPEEYAYLKDMPVVYYSNTGVYDGPVSDDLNSLRAYGDINKAIAALEAVGGGYIILTTDFIMNNYAIDNSHNILKLPMQNNNITKHSNMIILRGMDAEKTTDKQKVSIGVGGVVNFNGPVWLQNVCFEAIGTNSDEGLVSEEMHFGTPGQGVDDTVARNGKWVSNTYTTTPCIGSSISGGAPKKVDVSIHSGTFSGTLKLSGYFNGMNNSGNMYVNIEGGDLRNATFSFSHNKNNAHTTEGSAYINISGGKFKNAICFGGDLNGYYKVHIKNNLYVTITGGDFSQMAADSITSEKYEAGVQDGVAGTRTIDILNYEGSSLEKLRAAINDSGFDVLNVNSIYVDPANGNDNNDGLAAGASVKTLAKALEIIDKGENANAKYGGKIVFVGSYTVDETEQIPAHATSVVFNSQGSGKIIINAPLTLGGDSTFKNITLEVGDEGKLIANGNKLVMDSGVTVTGELDIIGGVEDGKAAAVNITVNSGTYRDIVAGDSVTGDVNITINDGKITGKVVGGSNAEDGEIGGSILINVNGGEFTGTIVATGEPEGSIVGGGAEINITGGDFDEMNQIQPGNSEVVGNTAVNYSKAPASTAAVLKNKVASTFEVIVAPRVDAPIFTKKDKFIFIIKNIGDPTKALTKTIPFKVKQSAAQKYSPIVVSPAQLNLPIDGSDQAILTVQPVNNVNTIRFTPNPNATKGSGIRVDGYNISGRGVNAGKYKYAEVVYYYTVPQGQTAASQKMGIKFYGNHSAIPNVFSTTMVTNKWASVILDFTNVFEGNTADVTQYHLSPMCDASGKTLTAANVPAGQYIDIVSMTFYSDKPTTSITGGKAPAAEIPEEGPKVPVVVEDINVKLSQIKSAVNGLDMFVATEKMHEGLPSVEYIPNRSYSNFMSIEGYGTTGKKVSSLDYQYVILKMYLKTETDVEYTPIIAVQNGGVTSDSNPVIPTAYSADKPLVPNQWNTVVVKIAPENPDRRNFMQVHIRPFGTVKNPELAEGDVVYIAEMKYSAKAPEDPKAEEEETEVEEVEQEIIAESPAVVVAPEKLRSSATNVNTFKSTLGEFDGKKVVMIKANKVEQPLTIDGAAIFGETEQTPGGALSLTTHRYAVISYYYATSETETTRAPEFDLLGGRIQTMENVINGVTAKGEALKVNQWATAVVKLTGNGSGKLTSGFNLRPFGDTSANNIASDDVLYIENITFVSNRP